MGKSEVRGRCSAPRLSGVVLGCGVWGGRCRFQGWGLGLDRDREVTIDGFALPTSPLEQHHRRALDQAVGAVGVVGGVRPVARTVGALGALREAAHGPVHKSVLQVSVTSVTETKTQTQTEIKTQIEIETETTTETRDAYPPDLSLSPFTIHPSP